MLFTKSISTLNFEDVEEFCARFREDIRVEYKSTFDNSVKAKLPKILSSFANSYGGILIIGIDAPAGAPIRPYDGIIFAEREPGLTVQNLCRSAIFPEIPLYTSLIASRESGKAFLVVQVNESPKAPHAIENSTRVYVRTEGGTERIALADLGRVERMLLRRQEVSRRWDEFFAQSRCPGVGTSSLLNHGPSRSPSIWGRNIPTVR
jgi:predicted HTH transcriptional regulator